MKLEPSRCPLVAIGAWNLAIFTPDWVGDAIFGKEDPQLEVGFGPWMQTRFIGAKLKLFVQNGRLQLLPADASDETLSRLEQAAKAIFKKLPETPVSAFGVNFGFELSESNARISDLLALSDIENIERCGGALESISVARKIRYEGRVANVTIARLETGAVYVDLNFSRQVSVASQASDLIDGHVLSSRDASIKFVREVYDIKVVAP